MIDQSDFAQMQEQVREMHAAMIGNKITQDGGMVGRMNRMETKQATQDSRIDKVEKEGARLGWHFKLLWGAAGGILMAMYSLFIKK